MMDQTRAMVNPPHGHYRPDHLEAVKAEMRRRGPPVLRAAWDAAAGVWHAREGTHRLRAAIALGVTPILVPVPWKRSAQGRTRALFAALRNAHTFERVEVRLPLGKG